MKHRIVLILFFSLFPSTAHAAKAMPAGSDAILNEIRFDQKLDAQLPLDLPFRDESGRNVRLGDYFRGKPVILAPVYYECPMLCTLTLNGLLRALRAIHLTAGDDFEVVAFSFNPAETPDLARAKKDMYTEGYRRPRAASGWHFLTGSGDAIRKLTKTIGFHFVFDPRTKQYAHASGLLVVTPQGRVSRYFYGSEYSANDIRLSLIEASGNKIGSLVDHVLLYCYHYDPAAGGYSLRILTAVRAAGAGTVVALVGGFFWMNRREPRAREPRVAAP